MRGRDRGSEGGFSLCPTCPSLGPSAETWLLLVGGEKDEGRGVEETDWDAI